MQKSVFDFIDYRRFLEHFYREEGIRAPSLLKSVIDGERDLTTPMIGRCCRALRLEPRDAKFFSTLVRFNQARTAREKQDHYAVLRNLGDPVREEVLRGRHFDYFDKWQTPIIREIVAIRDFGDDWEALGRAVHPPVSPVDARQAVETLLELGLIEKRATGGYRRTKQGLAADEALTGMSVRAFHGHMLEHAKRALHELGKHERNQSSLILGLSPGAYAAVVEELRAFKDRIKALAHRDEASSRVYQFSLDLFPVSADLPAAGA